MDMPTPPSPPTLQIGSRLAGPGHAPYIIAELGVNHDGSPDRALELVEAAVEAGADAVKFQLFRADLLMSKASRPAAYQRKAGDDDAHAMLQRLELSLDQLAPAVFRAHQRGIHAIVTVFSTTLVSEAQCLGWDAYKTASPDIIHKPLLDQLAATGKPLIISTGAATLDEVRRASDWLRGCETALMQCVSAYPTREALASIGAIGDLARTTGRPVGYSDHTTQVETGAVAVAAGACILEKHLTHSRHASGPDHAASLEPAEFGAYVRLARRAHAMLGDGRKVVLDIERDVREVSRQSVVAARSVPRGKQIEERDLTVKRPGTGLPPFMLRNTVGRVAARDIEEDTPIVPEDLA